MQFYQYKRSSISVVQEISSACGAALQRRSKTQVQLKELHRRIQWHRNRDLKPSIPFVLWGSLVTYYFTYVLIKFKMRHFFKKYLFTQVCRTTVTTGIVDY